MSDNDWISAHEAQRYLNRGDRMLRIYARRGKLRSRIRGRRLEYYRPDVETLRSELPADDRQRVPDQQIMPAGAMLEHIAGLERQLNEAMAQIGYLRGQLETHQLQLHEARDAQRLLMDKQREAEDLRRELAQATSQTKQQRLWFVMAIVFLVIVAAFVLYLGVISGSIPR